MWGRTNKARAYSALMMLSLVFVVLMPSSQSLWIDEGTTAYFVQEPTFSDFTKRIEAERGSDAQWPLGMVYFWTGARLVGDTEVGLRTLSAFWIGLAVLIMWRVALLTRLPYLPVLFACNAFVWYYGGEARPYAMQIGLGSALLYSLVAIVFFQSRTSFGILVLFLSGTLLSATGMLGVVPFGVALGIAGLTLARRSWRPRPRDIAVLVVFGAVLALLGSYYVWALVQGKGAHTVGSWGVGAKNLVFGAYELLGFVGFGPGRYALREFALTGGASVSLLSLIRPSMVGTVLLAALYVLLVVFYFRSRRNQDDPMSRLGELGLLVIVASAAVLLALSVVADFPFWGRHLAPVSPFVALVLASFIDSLKRNPGRISVAFTTVLCATLLASSLLIRFQPEHRRDDYRGASHIARSAVNGGLVVWWAAGTVPSEYYDVRFCSAEQPIRELCVFGVKNLGGAELSKLPFPDLVIMTKPDLHDKSGAIRRFIRKQNFDVEKELMAFQIFGPT